MKTHFAITQKPFIEGSENIQFWKCLCSTALPKSSFPKTESFSYIGTTSTTSINNISRSKHDIKNLAVETNLHL